MWSRILRNFKNCVDVLMCRCVDDDINTSTHTHSRTNQSGFTLIEILISVALISLIMLMIWQTTSQTLSAKRRMEKRDAVFHSARVSMDKIVQDFSQAFLLKGDSHLGKKQGSPVLKTVFKGDADQASLASLSHLRLFSGSKESESAEVGYKLEQDPEKNDFFVLMRRESKEIDNNPEEGGVWIPLAKGVKKLSFEYYDGTKFDWKNSWNSESIEKEQLPRAVRIQLVFEDPGKPEKELPFTTVALVEMYRNAIDF